MLKLDPASSSVIVILHWRHQAQDVVTTALCLFKLARSSPIYVVHGFEPSIVPAGTW
jgi:hypothetical protein